MPSDEGRPDRLSSRAAFLRAVLRLRRSDATDSGVAARLGRNRDRGEPDQRPDPEVQDGKGGDDAPTAHPA